MKNPHLIQRCSIIAPWHHKHRFKPKGKATLDLKVSELLRLDYMGSAEFEFGAIPATIRRMGELEPFEFKDDYPWVGDKYKYEHVVIHTPTNDHIIPCIIKADVEKKEFTDFLQKLSSDSRPIFLKENTGFKEALEGKESLYAANFWWCIDEGNEFVFSIGQTGFDAVQAFPTCIRNSITYMNAQKALKCTTG